MHRAAAITIGAAAVGAIIAACGSDSTAPASTIVHLATSLTPGGEIGATLAGNPQGSGTFTATLDTSTNVFTYTVQFSGLTSNVTSGHIHGPFTPGGATNSAGVILNFDPTAANSAPGATFTKGATSGTASGTITLTAATQISSTVNGDSLKKLLLAGKTYANIHTASNGGGEIRGQIVITP